ncbi:uncharacterized protein B0H18DRAFT_1121139 [Fomitopsis serialis]|uniref:uncharacterized protein n=1 Tax=Fomitopsis serialis TaxID=139415 RepID=UPI002008AADF|nr:uncharacterized protein B0H18DRAFT_1121139 [Neoantrodia serialis]KAH9922127.1 hypothetical protein B0H18DRAFT_1121139 [Neoantrodia serialis]
MQQPSRPVSPTLTPRHGHANATNDSETLPDPYIERLRAASLVKSPNKLASPTNLTGVSYAGMASRPATPPALLALKKANAKAAAPTTRSTAVERDGPATTEPAQTQQEVINVDAATPEVVIKEEEDLELNALALRRTRSDKQQVVAKVKNRKQRSKKSAKAAGKAPMNIGKGTPNSVTPAAEAAPPPDLPQRSTSDVRKRRRVSTDVDGDHAAPGVTTRTQDVPTTSTPVTQTRYVVDIGEVLGFPRYEASPGLNDDRDDPPAATTSDVDMRDIEPASDGSYSTRRIVSDVPDHDLPYLKRTTALHEGDIEDMYEDVTSLPYQSAPGQAGPSRNGRSSDPPRRREDPRSATTDDDMSRRMRDIEAASRAPRSVSHRPIQLSPAPASPAQILDDDDARLGPRRPRSPSVLHPHPVHYAPGPFPNFAPPRRVPYNLLRQRRARRSRSRGRAHLLKADEWRKATDHHVFIHFPGRGAHDKGNFGRLCAADNILRVSLNIPTASITQPIAAVAPTKPNSSPTYYRVGNLTVEQRDRLLREGWVSTAEGTFGVVPSDSVPPTFLASFRHPERLCVPPTEEGLTDAFKKGMMSTDLYQHVRALLTIDVRTGGRWRHLMVGEAHRCVVDSVRVRLISIRDSRDDEEEPIAFLYMESPTADATEWLCFRERIIQLTRARSRRPPDGMDPPSRTFAKLSQLTDERRRKTSTAVEAEADAVAEEAEDEEVTAVAEVWIVVARKCTSTATNYSLNTHTDDYSTTGNTLLCPREANVSPAHAEINDRVEEPRDGAALRGMRTPINSAQGNAESCVLNNPEQSAPVEGHTARTERIIPSGRKTKASLHIGSLNLNGRGSLNGPRDQKWNAVNQLLREERLGVLCLQETHLDETHTNTIQDLYGRRIRIWNSGSESTTSSQGVAVVLNRELVDVSNVIDHDPQRLRPNSMTENAAFWSRLLSMAEKGRFKAPDIMTGDFNLVEESIDRLPAKEDYASAVEALRDLIRHFDLYDGWRLSEPNKKDYSYPQRGSVTRSRIDRIYASEPLVRTSHTWDIKTTGVHTDHRLISAKLNATNTPLIGKGRWSMPPHLIEDKVFMEEMGTLGKAVMETMQAMCHGETALHSSPVQGLHKRFKEDIQKLARERLKKKIPKLRAELKRLRDHVTEIESRSTYQFSSELQNDSAVLHNRICELEKKRHTFSKLTTTARYVINAERVTKYWSAVNREKTPRDVIYTLRLPDTTPPRFEVRSDKMATLARGYHEHAQSVDVPGFSKDLQAKEIEKILTGVTQTLDPSDSALLQSRIYKDEVKRALKKSQTGRAPGLDGIPMSSGNTS